VQISSQAPISRIPTPAHSRARFADSLSFSPQARNKNFSQPCGNVHERNPIAASASDARTPIHVLDRDGWKCQQCGRAAELHVHHIQFRSGLGDDEVDNLITLCSECHRAVHNRVAGTWRRAAYVLQQRQPEIKRSTCSRAGTSFVRLGSLKRLSPSANQSGATLPAWLPEGISCRFEDSASPSVCGVNASTSEFTVSAARRASSSACVLMLTSIDWPGSKSK